MVDLIGDASKKLAVPVFFGARTAWEKQNKH